MSAANIRLEAGGLLPAKAKVDQECHRTNRRPNLSPSRSGESARHSPRF